MLEEMDEEFGVGSLIEEEVTKKKTKKAATVGCLKSLRVKGLHFLLRYL